MSSSRTTTTIAAAATVAAAAAAAAAPASATSTGGRGGNERKQQQRNPSTTAQRQRQRRQPRKMSVAELLDSAEQAMVVADDPKHAVTLYTVALSKCQNSSTGNNKNGNSSPGSNNKNSSASDTTAGDDAYMTMIDILEKRAELYVSLQHPDLAVQDYQRALELLHSFEGIQMMRVGDGGSHDDDPQQQQQQHAAALHMYIGQLTTSHEALGHYQRGMDCLQQQQQQQQQYHLDHVDDNSEWQEQIVAAQVAVAELYLTDLCFEENAESECERHLQMALQLLPDNLDALQTSASLRFSQQRNKEAVPYVWQVYEKIQTGCQALAQLVGLREQQDVAGAVELVELEDVQKLPPFEFRCQTAKLLLESCPHIMVMNNDDNDSPDNDSQQKQQQHYAQAAIDVIGSLLAENDEVIEIWILAGDAFAILEQHDHTNDGGDNRRRDGDELDEDQPPDSCHYWQRALEMLTVVQDNLEQEQRDVVVAGGGDDMDQEDAIQQQLDEVACQMEDVRAKLEEAASGNHA